MDEYPEPGEPGACLERSPLRIAFDILLILTLFVAYYPQFKATLRNHNVATALPRSYILLTLLFVTFLNTSHMTGLIIFAHNPRCVPLDFSSFFTSTGFRSMIDIAQTGVLWWCEFVVCICWVVASRRRAVMSASATPPLARVDEDEYEEEDAETAALLGAGETGDSSATDSVFGREISPKQAFWLNTASIAAIWCLSTGLYILAHTLSTDHSPPPHAPDWGSADYRQRVGVPLFITLRVLTMLTFLGMFVPVVLRLRSNKAAGLDGKSLMAQSVVLALIALSLAQMAWVRQGGMHDARQVGMALWMEAAVTLLALGVVRVGVAWWMGKGGGECEALDGGV